MLITVIDKDFIGDDLLCYTYISLSKKSIMKIKLKWEQLYLEKINKTHY